MSQASSVLSICAALDLYLSEQKTEQISFHVIRHFCKSAPSSPSSPPFNHVLFCWKHLPPPVIAPTVSSVLYSPSFTLQLFFSFFFFFFLTCCFVVTGLLLWKCCLVCAHHVLELCILSYHHIISLPALPSTCSEINQHWLPSTSTGGKSCSF